jgi:two-component system LytT family sensor kinase
VEVVLGIVLGAALAMSALALWRLARAPQRVVTPSAQATQAALHAAAATLPHLRQGLNEHTAGKAAPHLRVLTQAAAVAVADSDRVLAVDGDAGVREGDPLSKLVDAGRDDRVHVEPRLTAAVGSGVLGPAVVAPLVVQERRIGTLVACFGAGHRLEPGDTRVVEEVASLVAAQVELSAVAAQGERLARAELRALRAQISPHFIYNALAAVANYVHTRPEEARELLTEFAEFTRYAFRGNRSYVTLADELRYVEKYLRLEQARFGDRLTVRVEVAPEVLAAVVPVLSLQPLVENAVRHGVEQRAEGGRIELAGHDLGSDVELVVRDDGPGIAAECVGELLDGGGGEGIGLSNVHGRLQATFGDRYGLRVGTAENGGTEVRLCVPKYRAGVRAS